MKITYRYADDAVAGVMNSLGNATRDAAILTAQKYMAQFPAIESATVETETTETVVSRATEWNKRNG